jgi:hypothetical protein
VVRDLNFTELVITVVPEPAVPSTPSNGTTTGGGAKKTGISYSEKIALGVGLGMGVPAVLVATFNVCFTMRRRSRDY